MARILTALVFVMVVAFVGATFSFVSGNTSAGVVMLVAGLLASLAMPIAVAIFVARRAHAAVTTFGAGQRRGAGTVLPRTFDPDAAATSERPPSTWLPSASAKTFTTTTTTTSGDLDPATAEAMVRSLTGMGLDELVRRATSGELIEGVDVDVTRREYTLESTPDTDDAIEAREIPEGGMATRSATATVHGVRDTGMDGAAGRIVEVDLLVSLSGEAPYRAVIEHDFSPAEVPRLGQTVWVKVDPERPDHVELS